MIPEIAQRTVPKRIVVFIPIFFAMTVLQRMERIKEKEGIVEINSTVERGTSGKDCAMVAILPLIAAAVPTIIETDKTPVFSKFLFFIYSPFTMSIMHDTYVVFVFELRNRVYCFCILEKNMEIELLEELIVFEKMGTLSKTAEYLHTTQPTISRNLQRLEYDFGVSLFDKKKNKIRLNENGKMAVEYAKIVLRDYERMKEEVKAFSKKQFSVVIGSCAPLPSAILVARLSFSNKNAIITSVLETEEKLVASLKDGTFQFIILPYLLNDPEVISHRLCSENLYVRCKKEDDLASLKSVKFSQLDGREFLLNKNIGFWREIVNEKMPNTQFLVQENAESVTKIFEHSKLVTFATDLGERLGQPYSDCVKIPIDDPQAKQVFYYSYLKKNQMIFEDVL